MDIEVRAFNLKTRRECLVLSPQVVTLRSGRRAVQGIASDDGRTRVFRIVSREEADRLSTS